MVFWFITKITSKYYHYRESHRLMYISCAFCRREYVYYYLVLLVKYFDKNKLWMKDSMTKEMNRYCHGHDKNNTALMHLLKDGKKVSHIKEFLNIYLDISVKCESLLDLETVEYAIEYCQKNPKEVKPELQTILENYVSTHHTNKK